MDDTKRLHLAARNYTRRHFKYWVDAYAEAQSDETNTSGPNIFPRYNLLEALRIEIEKRRWQDWNSIEEARDDLVEIGKNAQSAFTSNGENPIETKAKEEEREKFIAFVSEFDDDPEYLGALTYNRIFTNKEANEKLDALFSRWGLPNWGEFPTIGNFTITDDLESASGIEASTLQSLYGKFRGGYVTRINWVLDDDEPGSEVEYSDFWPVYRAHEEYWFDDRMDWFIHSTEFGYAHLAGDWPLRVARQLQLRQYDPSSFRK